MAATIATNAAMKVSFIEVPSRRSLLRCGCAGRRQRPRHRRAGQREPGAARRTDDAAGELAAVAIDVALEIDHQVAGRLDDPDVLKQADVAGLVIELARER